MKQNLPVTDQQVHIEKGISLVSKTDLKGLITYANKNFLEISGFELEELVGKSHNMVRHPDMPAALFSDMWKQLHKGKPWRGILKNRCKNGDFYWIDACIVPIRRNHQTIGYMSVRKHVELGKIIAAQAVYAKAAVEGRLPKVWSLPSKLGIRLGMRAGTVFVAVLMLAGGALGIGGLHMADDAFQRMYQQQFEPVTAVGEIETRLQNIRASILEAQLASKDENKIGFQLPEKYVNQLHDYYGDIDELFDKVDSVSRNSTPANTTLFNALKSYVQKIQNLIDLLGHANAAWEPVEIMGKLQVLEHKASLSAQALRHSLADEAQQEIQATLQRNEKIRNFAMLGIALGLLFVVTVGHLFVRGVVKPLNAAIRRLNRIAEGDLQDDVDLSGTGETAQLNHAATVMQQHLKVMLDEIALAARHIHRHCHTLNQALFRVTEHSEEQHDQVYSALRALDAAVTETIDLSTRAEHLLELASRQSNELSEETRELATATRLAAFGAEEVAGSMRQVAELIVENRGEAQLAWKASEELIQTAQELNKLVDFFEPNRPPSAVKNAPRSH